MPVSGPPRILVAGALHLDVIVRAPRLPQLDETLVGAGVRYALGGKGGNQAIAARRMGAAVAMAGRIGSDAFGGQLLALLAGAGVGCAGIVQGPGASGMSVAIVEAGGEYGAVIVSGENLNLSAADIPLPAGTGALVLQNEVPEAVNLDLARRARAAGIRVILNAAPARAMPGALWSLIDLLVVNRLEARQLLGRDLPAPEAAGALRQMGPGAVIVTLGAEGLALAGPDGAHRIAAHRVAMVSAHGAGDAFIGALAAEWAGSGDLERGARLAAAFAALHVSSLPEDQAFVSRRAALDLSGLRD
ncbi:MAG: PfkB family carbohydrate kinase [Paracoccaceae bacterium]